MSERESERTVSEWGAGETGEPGSDETTMRPESYVVVLQ
jgi:hypothetical protein